MTPDPHPPLPDCDCHRCAIEERDRLRAHPLTKHQADAIMDMARKLEDTGRLSVLARDLSHPWRLRNREVHCALQDYLDSLSEPRDAAIDAAMKEP